MGLVVVWIVTLGPEVGSAGDDGCVRSNPVCEECSQKFDGEPMTALRCCSAGAVDAMLMMDPEVERDVVECLSWLLWEFESSSRMCGASALIDCDTSRPLSSSQTRQELRHVLYCGVISPISEIGSSLNSPLSEGVGDMFVVVTVSRLFAAHISMSSNVSSGRSR